MRSRKENGATNCREGGTCSASAHTRARECVEQRYVANRRARHLHTPTPLSHSVLPSAQLRCRVARRAAHVVCSPQTGPQIERCPHAALSVASATSINGPNASS